MGHSAYDHRCKDLSIVHQYSIAGRSECTFDSPLSFRSAAGDHPVISGFTLFRRVVLSDHPPELGCSPAGGG